MDNVKRVIWYGVVNCGFELQGYGKYCDVELYCGGKN
jgi:hypothetical protein